MFAWKCAVRRLTRGGPACGRPCTRHATLRRRTPGLLSRPAALPDAWSHGRPARIARRGWRNRPMVSIMGKRFAAMLLTLAAASFLVFAVTRVLALATWRARRCGPFALQQPGRHPLRKLGSADDPLVGALRPLGRRAARPQGRSAAGSRARAQVQGPARRRAISAISATRRSTSARQRHDLGPAAGDRRCWPASPSR